MRIPRQATTGTLPTPTSDFFDNWVLSTPNWPNAFTATSLATTPIRSYSYPRPSATSPSAADLRSAAAAYYEARRAKKLAHDLRIGLGVGLTAIVLIIIGCMVLCIKGKERERRERRDAVDLLSDAHPGGGGGMRERNTVAYPISGLTQSRGRAAPFETVYSGNEAVVQPFVTPVGSEGSGTLRSEGSAGEVVENASQGGGRVYESWTEVSDSDESSDGERRGLPRYAEVVEQQKVSVRPW